ncbi:hypothetical protein JW916_12670 [Candidatus Sumerlaeota bacterium]|nr:hypothetical protein [Candidatus Sumerlaeota bacterium]
MPTSPLDPKTLLEQAAEPVIYTGSANPDPGYLDGRLRHAVGVHSYQAMRANRSHPSPPGAVGWTYNHQPYLAYWKDRFWLQYLSDEVEEHSPPGRTLLMVSPDGREWSEPQVVFPEYALPEIVREDCRLPTGTLSVMHQRMGFYVAPNGRLLTLGFYGICPHPNHSPNDGTGVGRVVREVYEDGSFGPIYFIRYNRRAGWDESNTSYPFYTDSDDRGFVEACEALLADRLMVQQWWEEDQARDGFFALEGPEGARKSIQAFNWYTRPDGVTVGLWKKSLAALSPDGGRTWSEPAVCPTFEQCGAKVWGQRTSDGRYALVYNPSSDSARRLPLAVVTSDDGRRFDEMLCIQGDIPPTRFRGIHKNFGAQYKRGIEDENGLPPGPHMWLTYSMNKEDMWVSRLRVPIEGTVRAHLDEDFAEARSEADLELWNLYIPKWAPIRVVSSPDGAGRCLELRDEDPYDRACAQRAFPESARVAIEMRLMAQEVAGDPLDVEIQDKTGARPVRLRLNSDSLSVQSTGESFPIAAGSWIDVRVEIDCVAATYSLVVGDNAPREDIPTAEKTDTVERVVLRTGPSRNRIEGEIKTEKQVIGKTDPGLPGADDKSPRSVFLLDHLRTRGL